MRISVPLQTFLREHPSVTENSLSAFIPLPCLYIWRLSRTDARRRSSRQVLFLRPHSADPASVPETLLPTTHSVSVTPPETSPTEKAPRFRTDRLLQLHLWMQEVSLQPQQTEAYLPVQRTLNALPSSMLIILMQIFTRREFLIRVMLQIPTRSSFLVPISRTGPRCPHFRITCF